MKANLALIALVAALALVAAPIALAAPGGKGGDHANERASVGVAKAQAARANAAAEAENEPLDGDNETSEDAEPRGRGLGKALNATGAHHAGGHKGFAKAMAHVPEQVRLFMERVLAGVHPSLAKVHALENA